MITRDFPAVSQFLGCDFHEDWPEEFISQQQAVAAFLRDEPETSRLAVLEELSHLLRRTEEIGDLTSFVRRLGSCYDPTAEGYSMDEWLDAVRKRLAGERQEFDP